MKKFRAVPGNGIVSSETIENYSERDLINLYRDVLSRTYYQLNKACLQAISDIDSLPDDVSNDKFPHHRPDCVTNAKYAKIGVQEFLDGSTMEHFRKILDLRY